MKERLITDYHIHSEWSPDSNMSIQEAIEYCQLMQITDIAFTEHMDIGIQHKRDYHILGEYIKAIAKAKQRYPLMHILAGIEAGVNVTNLVVTEQFLQSLPFDYIIYSIHASQGIPYCSRKAYKKVGHKKLLHQYFEEMLFIVTNGKNYHSLGHLDYILRYQPYSLDEIVEYEEQIRQILRQLILHYAALEINTKGIQSLGRPHPPLAVLQWYRQEEGSLLVIGSDAHKASQIGEFFESALQWIQQAGFHNHHTFNGKMWQNHPL